MEGVKIGTVVNVVGLKGALKIYNYAERKERYEELAQVFIGDLPYEIEQVRYQAEMVILKVRGVEDRNGAEKLRGQDVFMREEDLPHLPPGQYYIRDLIGASVVDEEGERVGELVEIQTQTAQDLYCIRRPSGKMLYLPGVGEFVRHVDPEDRCITVRLPEGILQL